jgi:hypothetical protein
MVCYLREFVLLGSNILFNYRLLDLSDELDCRSLLRTAAMVVHFGVDVWNSGSTEGAIVVIVDSEFDISLAETFHEAWLFLLLCNEILARRLIGRFLSPCVELAARCQQAHRRRMLAVCAQAQITRLLEQRCQHILLVVHRRTIVVLRNPLRNLTGRILVGVRFVGPELCENKLKQMLVHLVVDARFGSSSVLAGIEGSLTLAIVGFGVQLHH